MGLVHPRPAMRCREERVIRARITFGMAREAALIAAGTPQPEAHSQAYSEAKSLKFTKSGEIAKVQK